MTAQIRPWLRGNSPVASLQAMAACKQLGPEGFPGTCLPVYAFELREVVTCQRYLQPVPALLDESSRPRAGDFLCCVQTFSCMAMGNV